MWEVTFKFSAGGKSVHVIGPNQFDHAVKQAQGAADFFGQWITNINIKVME